MVFYGIYKYKNFKFFSYTNEPVSALRLVRCLLSLFESQTIHRVSGYKDSLENTETILAFQNLNHIGTYAVGRKPLLQCFLSDHGRSWCKGPKGFEELVQTVEMMSRRCCFVFLEVDEGELPNENIGNEVLQAQGDGP